MLSFFRESMVAVGDRVLAINDSTLDNVKSAQVRFYFYFKYWNICKPMYLLDIMTR